ncbi:MAG TPA: DegT/DnrJ/EryC1/StrS family aminotransferase [Gaiellaceae bacterium]
MSKIPLIDVKAQYAPLSGELKARFAEVLESGQFILGPNVKAFETEAAAHLGVAQAVGCANGTDAITLVLSALGVGSGDEVICPAFTFYATAEPIALLGATPVFADIERETMNIDPADVARKITAKTKAIMPVHLFGRPAKVDELKVHGLPVIEDAAQAFGARSVAQKGIAATFSFFPTKNLFCLGDGGLVASNDEELAAKVRMLRFHGSRDKKTFEYVGYNSRLDEVQAAMLRVFLGQVKGWNELRRESAARYAELGLGELLELPKDEPGHVYHLFCTRSPERDKFRDALAEAGIGHACHYVVPLHLQPSMAHLGYKEGDLPETEQAARENLCVPLWAGIAREQQERVVATLQGAVTTPVQ